MNNRKTQNFVNDLKIRNLFPFYIENVNTKFFSSIQNVYKSKQAKNVPSFIKSRLDSDEIKKFWQFQDISSHENINLLINQLVTQLASKLGDSKGLFNKKGFTKFNQTLYVEEKYEIYDLKIIGDVYSDRRFIYAIDINPSSYLFEFLEQIQIFFYLDEKKKLVSGAFSLNWGNDNKSNSDENAIEKVYLNSFIKLFVSKEIGAISINNMLGLMSESFSVKNKKTKSKNKLESKNNKNSIEILKEKWELLLESKILNGFQKESKKISEKRIVYYKNDLFFSIVNVILICLAIYEELRKYFTNKDPELYLPLLGKTNTLQKENSMDGKMDFEFLIKFLKKRFFHFGKTKIAEIQSSEDAIAALIKFDKFENESFGNIISSYEIIRNSDIPFLDEDDDVFLNSKDSKILFLMIMKSELFGINSNNHSFTNYADLNEFIKEKDFDKNWNQTLDDLIDETICEWNYDYISFINSKSESFIIKNNNPIKIISNLNDYEKDHNRKIYNNYVWANVYTQTLIWMMKDIEEEISAQRFSNPEMLRSYVSRLESLQFDRYDSFYGISQVKNIVAKINEFHDFNYLNKLLVDKANKEDKLYGKGKERKNIGLAFMSTAVYGLLDFFTMVFSVLTVTVNDDYDIMTHPEKMIIIVIGSFFTLILISVLIYSSIVPVFINYRKNKRNYKI